MRGEELGVMHVHVIRRHVQVDRLNLDVVGHHTPLSHELSKHRPSQNTVPALWPDAPISLRNLCSRASARILPAQMNRQQWPATGLVGAAGLSPAPQRCVGRHPRRRLVFGCGEFRGNRRTDAELLAAHVAGDRYAFEELFHRHHRQLYRLAQLTSRNPDDAADAMQDAMLSAHRTAPAFRHDAAVSSWLYRIVVNACLDRLRRNKSRPTTTLLDDSCHVGDPMPRVDTAIVVERALMRLPVEQRAAVVAVDMQGYSVVETARMLGVAEGTVKSRCSRARRKLAETLDYFAMAEGGTAAASSPSNRP